MASRREWVRRIASHLAGELGASYPWEPIQDHVSGVDYENLSEAERDRIDAAIQEVIARLYRIGALRD
jgi:hypothetical protein